MWPPERTASGVLELRAKASPAATSEADAAIRIPRGAASSNLGFSVSLAVPYPTLDGRSRVPVTAAASADHVLGP
ncbi:hypothetical protein [Frondihabitans sucicola]|uniref:hypothetical protein n=1 Tax=Frondihabitans sucicola TaxID=1268041 RepID=UPI0025745C44|nr:hypothetical protein [Frondihabitans sucicola]